MPVNLFEPIVGNESRVPLVIRTVTPRTDAGMWTEGGSVAQGQNLSEYVLLSALPQELRERVVTAIKAQLVP